MQWTFVEDGSVLDIATTDDGRVSLDVADGPFVASKAIAERIRTAFGAATATLPDKP